MFNIATGPIGSSTLTLSGNEHAVTAGNNQATSKIHPSLTHEPRADPKPPNGLVAGKAATLHAAWRPFDVG